MDVKIIAIALIVLTIIIAGFYLIKIPTTPTGATEEAYTVVEQEMEQAVAGITAEDIESALTQ